jgi:hypothetical protein
MTAVTSDSLTTQRIGVALNLHRGPVIPVLVMGLATSFFLSISFVLCVLGYLLFPSLPVAHGVLSLVLPGFTLLTFNSFILGLVESFAWGWYVSVVFALLFNYFSHRFTRTRP